MEKFCLLVKFVCTERFVYVSGQVQNMWPLILLRNFNDLSMCSLTLFVRLHCFNVKLLVNSCLSVGTPSQSKTRVNRFQNEFSLICYSTNLNINE